MSFEHGKGAVFSLDDLAGSPTAIHAKLDSISGIGPGSSERPATTTFGATRVRRELLGLRDGKPFTLAGPLELVAGTKLHGKGVRFVLDSYAPQAFFKSGSIKRSIELPESQTFGDTWKERDILGLADGSVNLSGLLDIAAGASYAVIRALLAQEAGALLTLGLSGLAIGSLVEMCKVVSESGDAGAAIGNPNEVALSMQADEGIDLGVSLHDNVAETGAAPVTYTSVDETAASSDGGVGFLHVIAFSGTDCTIKIQHSANDTDWVDLITFTEVAGVTSERVAVAGTVNRYVRATISAATYTSVTFVVSFARFGFAYGTAGTHRHYCGLLYRTSSASFAYGPAGGAGSDPKLSGECRLQDYSIDFDVANPLKLSAQFVVTGVVTEGTY